MSSYYAPAYHPIEKVIRKAFWIDDYFEHHCYGIQFEGDKRVYSQSEVQIPIDKVFVEDSRIAQR